MEWSELGNGKREGWHTRFEVKADVCVRAKAASKVRVKAGCRVRAKAGLRGAYTARSL